MFAAYLQEGMTALDIGCGMGYFSIGMANMVGDNGKVIAVDLQQKMLDTLQKRAQRAGVADRITLYRCEQNHLGQHQDIDFALTFWMVHETPNIADFMQQIYSTLKPEGKYLLVEPKMHVSDTEYEHTLNLARQAGFTTVEDPSIRLSQATLFKK
jgi:ubiquinone/menaquinone biosynthesis C-methylase UbiE